MSDHANMLAPVVSSLHHSMNEDCYVDRLPPELLVHIIGFEVLDDSMDEYWRNSQEAWTAVHACNGRIASMMLVSRLWRDVILGASILWSRVTIGTRTRSSQLVRHLERSRAIPLQIYTFNCDPEVLSVLMPHLRRTKRLHILYGQDIDLSVLERLSSPAPILDDLSICLDNSGAKELPALFDGCAPRIKKLFLGPFGRISGNRFANLTHLRLANQMDIEWDISDFLDILEASPDLEELDMHASSPVPVDGLNRRITLRKMRAFHLSYHSWDQLVVILSHVGLPKQACLVVCDVLEDAGNDVASIFPEDVSHLQNLGQVTKLDVRHELGYVDVLGCGEDGWSLMDYSSSIDNEPFFHISSWLTLHRFLNLENITELRITISDIFCDTESGFAKSSLWNTVFLGMPALRQLAVSRCRSQAIIEALMCDTSCRTGPLFCAPKLNTLIINGDSAVPIRLLVALAQARFAHGAGLEHLHIIMLEAGSPFDMSNSLQHLKRLQGSLITRVCVEFLSLAGPAHHDVTNAANDACDLED